MDNFDSPSSTSSPGCSLSSLAHTLGSLQSQDELLFNDISELQLALRLELDSWHDGIIIELLYNGGRSNITDAVLSDSFVRKSGSGKQDLLHFNVIKNMHSDTTVNCIT